MRLAKCICRGHLVPYLAEESNPIGLRNVQTVCIYCNILQGGYEAISILVHLSLVKSGQSQVKFSST